MSKQGAGSGERGAGGPERRVITERLVREAARNRTPITVTEHDLITPAARDVAASLGVLISPAPPAASAASVPSASSAAVVALGSDHGGFALKESLKRVVAELGLGVNDVGCHSPEPVDYPVFAARVAELVASGAAAYGIMVDGAGIGSAMVANKIAGARAALCYDLTTARNAREHNNANVLTLGGGLIGERLAADIVKTFLATSFAGGRHERRVAMIDALDGERGAGSGEQ